MSSFPVRTQWPTPPSGASLSWRDVALLDLARHAVMRAATPLGSVEASTGDLWGLLRDEADRLGADVPDESGIDMLEPFALTWARRRAADPAEAYRS